MKHPEGGACQVKVISGYDEVTGGFARASACDCAKYEGKHPIPRQVSTDGCPHDYIKGNAHCLYCHKAQVVQ